MMASGSALGAVVSVLLNGCFDSSFNLGVYPLEASLTRQARLVPLSLSHADDLRGPEGHLLLPGLGLEHLTEPSLDVVPADEGGGRGEERLVDVGSAFIANGEAAEAAEPSQRALDDPAMPAQTLAAVHPAPRDPSFDPAPAQGFAAAWHVIGFVRMELGGAPAGSSPPLPDRRHSVDQVLEDAAVVNVGGGELDSKRDAVGICDEVTLGSRPTAIRRVRAGALAPLFAATLALSRHARLQPMAPARPSRSKSTRWSRSQTPASCHSRKRRQQVMPKPQPISLGSISQGRPERSTNRMPVSAARFGTRGRPPLGLGRPAGNSGSTTVHRSSERRG